MFKALHDQKKADQEKLTTLFAIILAFAGMVIEF